jgi:hypothetical protein
MKSIDIRTESAVKLLAEFLDMDTQYVAGERHVNAEHFAHGPSEFWALPATICVLISSVAPCFCFFYRNILLSTLTIQRSRHVRLCCTSTYDTATAMTSVHMADFRFAQKSMTPHRVSLLPIHTSARAAGNLVSGRNHHVHSHPISGHRIHTLTLLRFRNGICDPSAALHSPANSIQEGRIAHTARLRFHMSMIAVSHALPVHTHSSRVRESDEPQRVHSVLPNPI